MLSSTKVNTYEFDPFLHKDSFSLTTYTQPASDAAEALVKQHLGMQTNTHYVVDTNPPVEAPAKPFVGIAQSLHNFLKGEVQ
jgi:hypothetical protein